LPPLKTQVVTGQEVLNSSSTAGLALTRIASASGAITVIPWDLSCSISLLSLPFIFSVAQAQACFMALFTSFLSAPESRS